MSKTDAFDGQLAERVIATAGSYIPRNELLADLPAADVARIQAEVKRHYLRHWPVVSKRTRYVRARMQQVFRRMHAPEALLMLPVVESGYNPYALSTAGAMGLWQIMPGTARVLGLKRKRGFDSRRNVEASTEAALRYLLSLRKRFGNWPLALAAYHRGPYAVAKLIRKAPWQPADGLEHLPMPGITKAYVRHVLGLAALYHMRVIEMPPAQATLPMQVHGPVDLNLLAKASGMPRDELFHFNPKLNHSQYMRGKLLLHVPEERFTDVSKHVRGAKPKLIRTRVRAGDSLWTLARRFGTTVRHLRRINPGKTRVLRIGQQLLVPARRLVYASPRHNPLLSRGRRILYRVRNGDNLWNIARKFGTTTRSIQRANRLRKPSMLRPGDTLWVLARIRPS